MFINLIRGARKRRPGAGQPLGRHHAGVADDLAAAAAELRHAADGDDRALRFHGDPQASASRRRSSHERRSIQHDGASPTATSCTVDPEGAKTGMWLFLFTELLLFGGLFLIYGVYR